MKKQLKFVVIVTVKSAVRLIVSATALAHNAKIMFFTSSAQPRRSRVAHEEWRLSTDPGSPETCDKQWLLVGWGPGRRR